MTFKRLVRCPKCGAINTLVTETELTDEQVKQVVVGCRICWLRRVIRDNKDETTKITKK